VVDLIVKLTHEARSTITTIFAVGSGEGDGDFADLAVGPEVDGPPRERLGRVGTRVRGRIAVNREACRQLNSPLNRVFLE